MDEALADGTITLTEVEIADGAARAVVLPSEWYENAPMSVLEAYAFGKTVIGADIGGIPELIRPGTTGWLFPSGDSDALAAVLREAAALSAGSLMAMGAEGRQWVESDFSSTRYMERMRELYRGLGVQ